MRGNEREEGTSAKDVMEMESRECFSWDDGVTSITLPIKIIEVWWNFDKI